MMQALVPYMPVTIAWAGALSRLPAFRRRRSEPAQRAYWVGQFCFALSMTALLPSIYSGLDHLLGVPNLAIVLGNGVGLVAAWMALSFLGYLNYPEERAQLHVRRLGWLLLLTLVVMATFFALSPVSRETDDFWGRYGDSGFMPEYRLAFLSYLGAALTHGAHRAWRNASIADHPSLVLGLRVVTLGCLFGLAYVAQGTLLVAAYLLGFGDPVPGVQTVDRLLIAGTAGFIVLGSTLPAWGPRVGIPRLSEWLYRRQAYRRLYPLWIALYRAIPEIALYPPPSMVGEVVALRDLEFRLYRRVVEIRDGFLALRPYVEPAVIARALELCRSARLSDEETQAVVEAASLAVALERRRCGRIVNAVQVSFGVSGGADLDSEVAALECVARCYVRSPIVRTALALTEGCDAA